MKRGREGGKKMETGAEIRKVNTMAWTPKKTESRLSSFSLSLDGGVMGL